MAALKREIQVLRCPLRAESCLIRLRKALSHHQGFGGVGQSRSLGPFLDIKRICGELGAMHLASRLGALPMAA